MLHTLTDTTKVGTLADIKVMAIAKVTINDNVANTNQVTIKVKPAPTGTPCNKLWIVGDATPNGWNIDNPNQMKVDPTNAFQFKYNEVLTAGEFKIPVATGNWGTDYFMPPANGAGVTETNAVFVAGGNPDNKWKITDAGNYIITVNQLTETISIKQQ